MRRSWTSARAPAGANEAVRCPSPIRDQVLAALGLPDGRLVVTDGTGVGKLELVEHSKLSRRALVPTGPGRVGRRTRRRAFLGCDRRRERPPPRRLPQTTNVVVEAEGERFLGIAFVDDSTLTVGRGDGRVEIRDAATLEVRRTFVTLNASVMHLCAMDERTFAVADDAARTGVDGCGDGRVGRTRARPHEDVGLHRLNDGRLLLVGLSRQLSLFEADRFVAGADLGPELGELKLVLDDPDPAVAAAAL